MCSIPYVLCLSDHHRGWYHCQEDLRPEVNDISTQYYKHFFIFLTFSFSPFHAINFISQYKLFLNSLQFRLISCLIIINPWRLYVKIIKFDVIICWFVLFPKIYMKVTSFNITVLTGIKTSCWYMYILYTYILKYIYSESKI